jgi:hypothetical protein
VDNLGLVLRHRKIIKRRVYHVKRPNALWHLDGHHKMIRWGIVFHGFADGYGRTVSALPGNFDNITENARSRVSELATITVQRLF